MIKPVLEQQFYPMIKAIEDFEKQVNACENTTQVTFVVERSSGYNYVYSYKAFADGVNDKLNIRMADISFFNYAKSKNMPSVVACNCYKVRKIVFFTFF